MDSLKLLFIVLPGLFLAAGLILMGLSLAASFRRKRSMAGWQEASATVTGNLHGTDGPGSNGRNRFAPSYQFADAGGKRWLGQSDIYSQDQAIIGTRIPVVYNPANPAESTLPVFAVAKGRLATGLIMVIFGATAITMFASLSW
ncbi:DUF3592 domain-containing protein [Pseudarthrobacter sp. HLT3-5]|uniref:DUF3592 domain-containing protein n=1 Tax=Pseudarthrobacter cellobiosi TaxID=2953654 RepID=UPI00208ED05D|nr:DUF3592 domain-containing protein [Pseudarthrobacter sp. HLT3-5]MCO4275334.1 DUF3592 domain-containing protein [Pseudarthrobacter sp. HLT3-5]